MDLVEKYATDDVAYLETMARWECR